MPDTIAMDGVYRDQTCSHVEASRISSRMIESLRSSGASKRIAIPTGASSLQARAGMDAVDPCEQARWILEGRTVERVVIESLADREPFEQVTRLPVVHLCELAGVTAAEAPA